MNGTEDAPRSNTEFHTTRWTVVREAARGDDTAAASALENIAASYWQPLYRYVRRRGKSPSDAEDLVQGFLASFLREKSFASAEQSRGRFRAFLLGALKNHLAGEWQHEHRLKRGGHVPHLSIDWRDAESGLEIELHDARTPDQLFDKDWANLLMERVLDQLAREEDDFEKWKSCLSLRSEQVPYAELGARLGLSEGAARVTAHRLRKRYRQRLRQEIVRTLEDETMVDEEMRALFSALCDDFS
jgi:RNA polymerase sigma-70 factor (ECF subfamily)